MAKKQSMYTPEFLKEKREKEKRGQRKGVSTLIL